MTTQSNFPKNILTLILGVFMIALAGWFIYLIDNAFVYVLAVVYILPEGVDMIKEIIKNK